MQFISVFVSFVFVGKIITSNKHANKIAMYPGPWLIIVDSPVLIMLAQKRCIKVVRRYLNYLDDEGCGGDKAGTDVEELPRSHILHRKEQAWEHEPDIIGEVP